MAGPGSAGCGVEWLVGAHPTPGTLAVGKILMHFSQTMPSAIVYPGGNPSNEMRNVQSREGIDGLHSLLLFFDDLMLLTEARPSAAIQIGNPNRRLHFGADIDYLAERRLVFESLAPSERPLWQATKSAQESFASGNIYTDESMSHVDRDSHPRDVFVSKRAAEHYPDTSPTLTIEFVEGICVPPTDVALPEVLQFAEAQKSQRRAFWFSVFDLARRVDWMQSNNPEAELQSEILSRLEEFGAISRQTWGRRVVDSASFQFTLDRASLATIAGGAASTGVDFIPLTASIILGSLGLIRFSVELLPSKPQMPQGTQAMSFLSSIKEIG